MDWVGEKGFVVFPQEAHKLSTLGSKLFSPRSHLAACLAAIPDPPPAAWVRVACVGNGTNPLPVLEAMLENVVICLQETAVSELGWLVMNEWPLPWLPALGFAPANEIITYTKFDMAIPETAVPPDLEFRPAQPADMDILANIEAAAFDPLWRHSATGLLLAYRQSFSFDVAVRHGRVVGFQFSTRNQDNAHLVRMTIHPDAQNSGIGSALLAHAINGYRRSNLRTVSLNTQADNVPSQKLYTRFGFRQGRERLPIWVKPITKS